MIVFCEECGKKNQLAAGVSLEGKAVFRCSYCGFSNAYYLTNSPNALSSAVVDALKETQASTPWMIGSFVFHPAKKIILNQMPSALKPLDLEILGTRLYKSLETGSNGFDDIEALTVKIGDKCLSAVCSTASNMLVIVTSGQTLTPEVQQKITALFMKNDSGKRA